MSARPVDGMPHTGRRRVAKVLLRCCRWRQVGEHPGVDRYVLIASPHTSNWDLFYMLLVATAAGIQVSWLGKDSLFESRLGPVLRRLGGIPVDRSHPSGVVESLVGEFARRDRLVIAVPPSGTRSHTDHWRSGFYWVAHGAGVPIVCGFLDYGTRTGGFGPSVEPSGDPQADAELFRAFYADKVGKYPDRESTIRFLTDR